MIHVTGAYPPLTGEKVQEFEAELGARLPPDYRAFLLQHNGGVPSLCCFDFTMNGSRYSDCVRAFLGLVENQYLELRSIRRDKRDLIPPNMLAVAYALASDLICLSIQGDDYGKVYFWDGGEATEGAPDYSNLWLLADNFDAFLAKLYE